MKQQKQSLPPQLTGGIKAKKSKEKKEVSPFNTKVLLHITKVGEIYREGEKIYLKVHMAQYPKLLAQLVKYKDEQVLYIKDRNPDGHYFQFNAFLMEKTKCEHILFEKEKEFFLLPVERIQRAGLYSRTFTKVKPIDLTLKFPYPLMRMYHLKDYPGRS